MHQHLHYRGFRRRRETENSNYSQKLSQHEKGKIQVQEPQSPKQNKPKEQHAETLIKLIKIKSKKKILKVTREKQKITYKGIPIKSSDFSSETLKDRQAWHDIFKVTKGKRLQLRILYPARLLFRLDGEIKSLLDQPKRREFTTTKTALQVQREVSRWKEKGTAKNKKITNGKAHR